jgi:hypothetical protein
MKKGILGGILCFLIVTAAHAESAWILWERSCPVPDEWMMINGFQTHDQCKEAKKDAYEAKKRTLSKIGYKAIEEVEDCLSMWLSGKDWGRIIDTCWMCLPNTTDPRK